MLVLVWQFLVEQEHFPVYQQRQFLMKLEKIENYWKQLEQLVFKHTLINYMNNSRLTKCIIKWYIDHAIWMACQSGSHPLNNWNRQI
jgi:hypothetical protein